MGGGTRAEVEEGGCRLCDVGQAWPTWDVFVCFFTVPPLCRARAQTGEALERQTDLVRGSWLCTHQLPALGKLIPSSLVSFQYEMQRRQRVGSTVREPSPE